MSECGNSPNYWVPLRRRQGQRRGSKAAASPVAMSGWIKVTPRLDFMQRLQTRLLVASRDTSLLPNPGGWNRGSGASRVPPRGSNTPRTSRADRRRLDRSVPAGRPQTRPRPPGLHRQCGSDSRTCLDRQRWALPAPRSIGAPRGRDRRARRIVRRRPSSTDRAWGPIADASLGLEANFARFVPRIGRRVFVHPLAVRLTVHARRARVDEPRDEAGRFSRTFFSPPT